MYFGKSPVFLARIIVNIIYKFKLITGLAKEMPEEVVVPTLEPFPEYDDLKKSKPEVPKEEEVEYIEDRKPASFKRICVTIFLSWLMVSLVIGTLAIVYQPTEGPLIVIVSSNFCANS